MLFGQPLYQLDASLIMVLSILLIYSAVFLWLFFKYDFASAQQSAIVIIIAWFGVFKLQDYLNSSGAAFARIVRVDFLYLLLLAALAVFLVSYKLSINIFASKE
jgi:hypothetical protein